MKSIVFRVLFLICSLNVTACLPARVDSQSGLKVRDGVEVERNAFPNVVRVKAALYCTGTMIAPKIILTASHCYDNNVAYVDYRNHDLRRGEGKVTDHRTLSTALNRELTLLRIEDRFQTVAGLPLPLTYLKIFAGRATSGAVMQVLGYGFVPPSSNQEHTHLFKGSLSFERYVENGSFEIAEFGASPAMVTSGDSGGPVFTTSDNETFLFGIVSKSGFANVESMSDERIREIQEMDDSTFDQQTDQAIIVPLAPHISWIESSIQELSE